ncbi:AAA family ATPase [Lentzea sp. NEAU-D7]|uniref:AAA family ATPase n=1 Tax=Lentzea sp. NEAU-D7 TaxID=2994667 RepID=UPI00224AED65|nr:AAA family ATPase [Lentzea sp. NEAU-D7]MCX2952757.1 AAA family ATPase [Lentzea sp. NEAU-D7]
MTRTDDWHIYTGTGQPAAEVDLRTDLPEPPPWRVFRGGPALPLPPGGEHENTRRIGAPGADTSYPADRHEIDMVNAALLLRRPLLVTGGPGTGKTSLAFRVARELSLGPVLTWPVTSSTKLRQDGLYEYDAIGRVHASSARASGVLDEPTDIGDFIHLGPLGTALLPYELPRVLVVDEVDKADLSLPHDLLAVLEDGEFLIRELARVARRTPKVVVHTADPGGSAEITEGRVVCRAFPFIVFTSNREREFPPAFLRRTLQLEMQPPNEEQLASMVAAHFRDASGGSAELIRKFLRRSESEGGLAIDQLLNTIQLASSSGLTSDRVAWERLRDALWHRLSTTGFE